MNDVSLLAPCGLDCQTCAIRLIPINPNEGQKAIDWFKSMGWLKENEGIEEAIKKNMYCKGCRGERDETHWSPDCVILKCCVDKKKLTFCYECNDLPCKDLIEWGEMAPSHNDAIEKLKELREKL